MRSDSGSAAYQPLRSLSPSARVFCLAAVLVVVTLAAYWQVLDFPFVDYDDPTYVTDNPQVKNGLTADGIRWAFTTGHASNWHPLTWLSHMLDCTLFGLHAGRHHLVNVMLHAANAVLLLELLRRLTGRLWPAAFVAGLFALHPLHVESVAWVAERKDLLSTLLGLLALGAYAGYARRGGVGRYLLVTVLLALGLLAKPMLVTLPAVMLLLDYWPLDRMRLAWAGTPLPPGGEGRVRGEPASSDPSPLRGEGRVRGEPATTLSPQRGELGSARGPVAATGSVRQRHELRPCSFAYLVLEKLPLLALSAVSSVVTYLMQAAGPAMDASDVVPFPLRLANAVVSYVRYLGKMFVPQDLGVLYTHPNLPGGEPWPAGQVAAATAVLVAVTALVLWQHRRRYLLVGWLWYLGMLVPVSGLIQVGHQALADRYTYLPLTGVFVMIAFAVADALGVRRRAPSPREPSAPHGPRWLVAGLAFLILTACAVGTWHQARHWRDSEALLRRALAVSPSDPTLHLNFGTLLQELNRPSEAIEHFRAAVQHRPQYGPGRYNLGLALSLQGHTREAIEHLREARRLEPENRRTRYFLGMALQEVGEPAEAIAELREAVRLDSNWAAPMNVLAFLLVAAAPEDPANIREAVSLAERAATLTQERDPGILNTLATVYAVDGQIGRAIATLETALPLAEAMKYQPLVDHIREQLDTLRRTPEQHERPAP